jgi:SNF2 family DNA or RNA helicase
VEGYAAGGGAAGPSRLNAAQLARLHAVLSPFMLRRVKADVLNVSTGGRVVKRGLRANQAQRPDQT